MYNKCQIYIDVFMEVNMAKYNFEKYFSDSDVKYYDAKTLIVILEDILGKDINAIRNDIDSLKINVDRKQIEEYLDKVFEDENPELKKRIENPKPRKDLVKGRLSLLDITIEDIEESSRAFVDQLDAIRYSFEPYTLEYFNRYTDIVRNKAIIILNIIEKIANKDCDSIVDLMMKIDIQLNENGDITKEDIVRLISPFVYNFNMLNEKVNSANNLSTYLDFKISKHSVYKNGWSEGELYPTTTIQVNSLYYDRLPGNIALSDNQRKILQEEESKSRKRFVKDLLDW